MKNNHQNQRHVGTKANPSHTQHDFENRVTLLFHMERQMIKKCFHGEGGKQGNTKEYHLQSITYIFFLNALACYKNISLFRPMNRAERTPLYIFSSISSNYLSGMQ